MAIFFCVLACKEIYGLGSFLCFSKCPGSTSLDKYKVFRTSRERPKEMDLYDLSPFASGHTHSLTAGII